MPNKINEKVILVHIDFTGAKEFAEDLEEFQQLALSAGAKVVATITGKRQVPDAKYFVGSGKAEEILQHVKALGADLVIFNHPLSPGQERNLERLLQCRILDRTGLILDIFAQRARTFEGKLQVELAQYQHLAARLIRGWTHLERQRGGIGLRGPGETQLEEDRRVMRQRITTIKSRLERVRSQRQQSQRARKRANIPTIALIGYTNAGKSTLFNRLTSAEVFTADKLFATLDPTLRQLELPNFGKIILADTVGFIRHLPHELVEAFRATLEETKDADLLLHVIDAHDPLHLEKIKAVEAVLAEIDASHVPQLQIYNKIDLLLTEQKDRIDIGPNNKPWRIWLSAQTGSGIDELCNALPKLLNTQLVDVECCLLDNTHKLRAQLYELDAVVEEKIDANGRSHMRLRLTKKDLYNFFAKGSNCRIPTNGK